MPSPKLNLKFIPLAVLFIVQPLAHAADAVEDRGAVKPEPIRSGPKAEALTTSTLLKRTILPRAEDDARAQAVLNNLVKQATWFPNVTISVQQGVVTIKGSVKNGDHLKWLADTADRIPSVLAVINQATVETPPVSDFTPALNEFRSLVEAAKKRTPLIGVALLLAAFFYFVGRYAHKGMLVLWGRHISNPFLLSTAARLTMLPIWIVLFYLVLQVAGLSGLAATIIGGTGAIGIVLGFAFKDIAENYISGLILSVRSPFTKGDEVMIDGYEGYIQSLSMRGTTMTDYDGTMVLIPNRIVLQSVIKNLTANPNSRVVLNFGIGVGDSIGNARKLILARLEKSQGVLKDPAPSVTALNITKSAITLRLVFWYNSQSVSKFGTISEVIETVQEALLGAGISLMTEVREIAPAAAKPEQNPSSKNVQAPDHSARESDAFRINENAESMNRKPSADLFEN